MEPEATTPSGGNASDNCSYLGTDYLDNKIWIIAYPGTGVSLLSVVLNSFFFAVFCRSVRIRQTPVYYFGVLALLDVILAVNYVLIMSIPFFFDYYNNLTMYHSYLWYYRFSLTVSAIAMFASMMLILLATTERLLRTFHSRNVIRVRKNVMVNQFNVLAVILHHTKAPCYVRYTRRVRKFMERHRPIVCIFCVSVSFLYKLCVYFELETITKENCTDFSTYQIERGAITTHELYYFWWQFVVRNVIDRIAPFIALIFMNLLIIRALKKEYRKLATEPQLTIAERQHRALKRSLSATKPSRASLRDATRALISVVTTYIMSQALQVLVTFTELFYGGEDLADDYHEAYSYVNDFVSFLPLIASCLRFPIYCICNKDVLGDSLELLHYIKISLCSPCAAPEKRRAYISDAQPPVIGDRPIVAHETIVAHSASGELLTDDSEHEWQL